MSKIDKLIEKLCPNGVKFYELGELGKFYGGLTGKSKEDFKEGNAKFITYMNVYKNPALDIDVEDKVKIGENEKQRTLEYGDIIFTGSSETPDECGITSVVTKRTDEKLYLNSFCFFFRFNDPSIMYPDFAKHLFRSSNLRYQIGKTASGVTRFNVSKKLMEKVKIAVPPLEVQYEIVHILDDFMFLSAELSTELSAELKAREKQYEFYENKLFNFDENHVDYKSINFEEIATFSQGIQVDVNKQFYEPFENSVPFLRIVDFVNDNEPPRFIEKPNDKYIKKENEMIMIRYGASAAGRVFINKYGAIANNMFKINIKENVEINLKYLMYYLSQDKIYRLLNSSGKSTMPAINFGFLNKVKINIPSTNEQERIVKILDKFEYLTKNISEGLSAEIEAREKQYRYYSDKLLTFREMGCE